MFMQGEEKGQPCEKINDYKSDVYQFYPLDDTIKRIGNFAALNLRDFVSFSMACNLVLAWKSSKRP
jgi:hypothetical protein